MNPRPHTLLPRRTLILAAGVFALLSPLRAELRSARWEISPTPPLYEGQTCELRLLIETAPDEEVTGILLSAGPDRKPDGYDSRREEGRRITVCTWDATVEPGSTAFALPAARLRAGITETRQHGFLNFAQRSVGEIPVEAYACPVERLPGDAAGLPIGDFALTLACEPSDPRPGDVVRLRATAAAREGALPESLTFEAAGTPAGRLYPFRTLRATDRLIEAEAYYALPERPLTETLALRPLRAFDLKRRTAADVVCPPVTLTAADRPRPADGTPDAEEAPLRFAPDDNAPVLGRLAADRRVLETHGAWSRLSGGWIRTDALRAAPPREP